MNETDSCTDCSTFQFSYLLMLTKKTSNMPPTLRKIKNAVLKFKIF